MKRHRLLCNMLSSQPICFNLFGPLALDTTIAVALASALFRRKDLRSFARVIVEHEPEPRADHLDDATSFDAFVEVEDAEGDLGFIAVETKLTGPFSPTRYQIAPGSTYAHWLDHDRAPWRPSSRAAFENLEINQLFRDHPVTPDADVPSLTSPSTRLPVAFGQSLEAHRGQHGSTTSIGDMSICQPHRCAFADRWPDHAHGSDSPLDGPPMDYRMAVNTLSPSGGHRDEGR